MHGDLKGGWRENDPADVEEITVCAPRHPIAQGVENFTLGEEEMYGAPFGVPRPRSRSSRASSHSATSTSPQACVGPWERNRLRVHVRPRQGRGQGQGKARVFYFRPGHEAFRTYEHPMVRRALYNATLWAGHRI